jgi:hypothetical protein
MELEKNKLPETIKIETDTLKIQMKALSDAVNNAPLITEEKDEMVDFMEKMEAPLQDYSTMSQGKNIIIPYDPDLTPNWAIFYIFSFLDITNSPVRQTILNKMTIRKNRRLKKIRDQHVKQFILKNTPATEIKAKKGKAKAKKNKNKNKR